MVVLVADAHGAAWVREQLVLEIDGFVREHVIGQHVVAGNAETREHEGGRNTRTILAGRAVDDQWGVAGREPLEEPRELSGKPARQLPVERRHARARRLGRERGVSGQVAAQLTSRGS